MMNRIFNLLSLTVFISLFSFEVFAQDPYKFHSHNDYEQEFPFWKAYVHGAASIEADIFLKNGQLYVTHEEDEIKEDYTLQELYLKPISELAKVEKLRELLLLIDLKSDAKPTLDKLVEVLKRYPELINSSKLTIAISGNRPAVAEFPHYPDFIKFDFQEMEDLHLVDLNKIALISQRFKNYSVWNGLGRMTAEDLQKVNKVIETAKETQKPFRFWGAPDTKTAWSRFAEMGVSYINTDLPAEASAFLENLDRQTLRLEDTLSIYKPQFLYEKGKKPKNIILMIGDGNGLAQISSAMFANRGELTITQLKNIGLVKTSAYDNLVTDSAAGGTAMATGKKTRNRAIGTGPKGEHLTNITEILSENGFINGIITTDRISGATPASFFAHVAERDYSKAILEDLKESRIDFFVAACDEDFNEIEKVFVRKELQNFNVLRERSAVYLLKKQVKSDDQFPQHVKKALQILDNQDRPYFLIIEGAKIDSNGHTKNIEGIVEEMLDFDRTIAEVLRAADKNKNTLVLITADHETAGLGIMQGDLENGEIEGGFLTNDHTATMVPIFSYGPQSKKFRGVYENTAIFHNILETLEIEGK